jgi:hypothetical protein
VDQLPTDAGAPVGGLNIPSFDVADRLVYAPLRPVAQRHFDESNKLSAWGRRDKHSIAIRLCKELPLFALEVLHGVVGPKELPEGQPGVQLFRTYLADFHDVSSGGRRPRGSRRGSDLSCGSGGAC